MTVFSVLYDPEEERVNIELQVFANRIVFDCDHLRQCPKCLKISVHYFCHAKAPEHCDFDWIPTMMVICPEAQAIFRLAGLRHALEWISTQETHGSTDKSPRASHPTST